MGANMLEANYTSVDQPPLALIPVPQPKGPSELSYPAEFRDQIMIDVIHDGRVIPSEFLVDSQGRTIPESVFLESYIRERDWGASMVAARLSERLGLPGYQKINTARCLIDFGRFPGSTPKNASHLRRFAINYPFSNLLGFDQKRRLLEGYYDRISDGMDTVLQHGCVLKIAIHTYDQYNQSGTERPQVSLVSRALSYQHESAMPQGVFDPLFPDILAEFTSNRTLRDRISLSLHKSGIPVAHNYPYLLPEGSPEVRTQVWSYFSYLRHRFEEECPKTRQSAEYHLVWEMLLDTNLRSSSSESLRSYLHMYRRPPNGRSREFARAAKAYRKIHNFAEENKLTLADDFRKSHHRLSALGIEVRKDLVWAFDEQGKPGAPYPERAAHIADIIADAVIIYLNDDHIIPNQESPIFLQNDPWYRVTIPNDKMLTET